jgi:hypothetical protein
MLSWFRDKAKIFLIVIIVMFVGLIFVGWGTGNFGDDAADRGAIAKVNGTRLVPDQLLEMRAALYQQMKRRQEMMGNPAPDNELAFLEPQLAEEAFDSLVAGVLVRDYLDERGWPRIDRELAETFLVEQLRMSGQEDPETLLDSYREDPTYDRQLYMMMNQMSVMRFGAQVRMENMASAGELDFLNDAMLSSVEARYVSFRARPEPPDPDTLGDFYESHLDRFADPESSVLRYLTVMVTPSSEDRDLAAAQVDSLALSGAPGADTMTVTRARLAEYTEQAAGLAEGDITSPVEMQGGMGSAMHSWSVLEVSEAPESLLAMQDSLTVAHWQVPVRPGQSTIRETMWTLEEHSGELMDMEMPLSDSLLVIDFGETTVTPDSRLSGFLTEGLRAYALDSSWVGEVSPIFYSPSYRGAYPALTVVEKLSWTPPDTLSYQEALDSGRLELEAFTAAQREQSMEMAGRALEEMRSRAMGLMDYAEEETLEVRTTGEFVPMQVIAAGREDRSAVSGLLASREFGYDAVLMPELEPMGPYRTGGAAAVAEISSRQTQSLPEEAGPVRYLALQSRQSEIYRRDLLDWLRRSGEVVDLRDEYAARIDSIRAARDTVEAVPTE